MIGVGGSAEGGGAAYAGPLMATLPAADRLAWRPQVARPSRTARAVVDPVIEPLWEGVHLLAHVRDGIVRLVDGEGDDVNGEFAEIAVGIAAAIAAGEAVIDGWVTNQATRSGEGLALITVETSRGVPLIRPPSITTPRVAEHDRPGSIAFIAVDLLSLDDQLVLDLPLLERKRLLDSVVVGNELVRVSPYVRPPLERWLPSWQAVGFHGALLKAANSRYVPGAMTNEWTVAQPIPRR
jgi:ATP-dependent DNA ligase